MSLERELLGRARFERATIALKEQYLFYITLYINNLTFLFPLATLIESIDNLIQTAKIPLLFLRGKKWHCVVKKRTRNLVRLSFEVIN